MTKVPDTGTGHLTNGAPQGSPPQLQHGQIARARRTHRKKGSMTRGDAEMTETSGP